MSPYIHTYSVINKPDIDITKYLSTINLDNKYLVTELDVRNKNNTNYMMPISIGVASAITAYARIIINKLKLQFIDNLLYSDTDSAFFDLPLPDNLISDKLGALKLEYILKEGVFLGPKMYGGIKIDGEEFSKIKGFTEPIPFQDLKILLHKNNNLILNHDKWFRDFNNANINIKNMIYTVAVTENKRLSIYKNKNLNNTKPIKITK